MDTTRHQRILAECLAFLDANRITPGQGVIATIKHFFSSDKHSTIEELQNHPHDHGIDVSSDDIRKTMKLLVEYGFAAEKEFGDGKTRFEHLHIGEHHDHFYCGKCGKIIEFTCPIIEEQQHAVARRYGFHPLSHKMQIQGLCRDCFGQATSTVITLSQLQPGAHFQVVEIAAHRWGGFGPRRHLQDKGLVPGTEGEVLSSARGTMIILVAGKRIALRRGECARIQVLQKERSKTSRPPFRFLSSCSEGQAVTIGKIHGSGPLRKRLLEMGFVKGTPANVIRYAPLRDPMVLQIRGSRVSLRVCEADRIEIQTPIESVSFPAGKTDAS